MLVELVHGRAMEMGPVRELIHGRAMEMELVSGRAM
jgi:hypothetical protein